MGSFAYGALVLQVQNIITSGGTTTLNNVSKQIQNFTGTSAQTIVLPNATTMSVGQSFEFYNSTATSTLVLLYQDSTSFHSITAGNSLIIKLTDNGTANGVWVILSTSAAGGILAVGNPQTVAGGGNLTITTAAAQYVPVAGSGGPITLSATPFATNPNDGTMIIVEGTDNTNTVTLVNSDVANGCILNGDVTLGQYDNISLVWRLALSRYVEIGRSE